MVNKHVIHNDSKEIYEIVTLDYRGWAKLKSVTTGKVISMADIHRNSEPENQDRKSYTYIDYVEENTVKENYSIF